MNQELQRRINESMQYIRHSNKSGSHVNCIRLTNNNLKTKHTEKMIETCLEFLENKVPFITEAIFTNGSRCDILCPSTKDIIEILHTETDEMFKEKIKKYPAYFNVLKVRV